ncbi:MULTISPECIES: hypothetical protein [unclassified Streptomyces]|uniref:hypothetical protein n=1 Tax=unclassified Streptomyces TaxID=2593676 RepID=UPI00278BFA7D|nr:MULTISPECIES: hypothetical protein [unclassified Streptomyces]
MDRIWGEVKRRILPVDRKDAVARAKAAAAAAIPGLELPLSSMHLLERDGQVAEPPLRKRPRPFQDGQPMTDHLLERSSDLQDLAERYNPVNSLVQRGRNREAMAGDWDSCAGQLTRALSPRKLQDPTHVFCATPDRFVVVRLEGRLSRGEIGPRSEVAWQLPRQNLAWVRGRNDIRHNTHELGFTDGSWTTVLFTSDGWHALGKTFPQRLGYRDARPGSTD